MKVINTINGVCQIEEEEYFFIYPHYSRSLNFQRIILFIVSGLFILFSLFHFSIGISIFTRNEVELYDNRSYYIELMHLGFGIILTLFGLFVFTYARFQSTDTIILKKQIQKIEYINSVFGPKFEILYKTKNGEQRIKSIWLRKDFKEIEKAREIMAIEKMGRIKE